MSDIKVPTLGESVSEAIIAKWLKKEGEAIAVDEPIVELETDKVTIEVNATTAGVLQTITAQEGETVEVGATLGTIAEGAAPAAAPAAAEAPKTETAPAPAPAAQTDSQSGPAARKIMADNNVAELDVAGSGKDGRVTKGDVIAHVAGGAAVASAPAPAAAPRAPGAREERVKMSRLRQSIARRLKEAQNTAAMLTTFNEVDMTAVLELRKNYKEKFEKRYGVKLGFMGFFLKASVMALQEFPAVNAEIDGDEIVYKNHYDIGVAVSTPQGLVVPVVRDCETKSLADIEMDIGAYAAKARDGKLGVSDMTGGTFTVTNGGVFGSMMSTPILNTPQSAILGMHKTQMRPMVMPDGSIEARPMMYLALSYDHRIIDGREAVTSLVRIKEALEDPARMVLAI